MAHLINIDKVISASGTLLTLPDICLQLRRVANDPDSSVDDLTALIVKDPALTARLLKLVNSSLYYFPRKISSIAHAVTLVGTEQLYNLSLATSAASIIRAAGGSYIELKNLWQHSVYSGLFAQQLAVAQKLNSENLFVTGLLSNVGTLAVVKYAPEIAMSAIDPLNPRQFPWVREKEVLGFYLTEVSAALLEAWNLPEEIIIPLRNQHELGNLQVYQAQTSTLHIATRLASDLVKSDPPALPDFRGAIDNTAFEITALSTADLDEAITHTTEIGPEILQIFTL